MSPADGPKTSPDPASIPSSRTLLRSRLLKALTDREQDLAILLAIRLARMEPPHPDDLTVAATAWFARQDMGQARRLLAMALQIDPFHALAAKAMAACGPLIPAEALLALGWHAETNPEAAQTLITHALSTGQPLAYVTARRIHCVLPPGAWELALRWRQLVLTQSSLGASDQPRLAALAIPDGLRGIVDPVLSVNGTDLPSGPVAASWLAAPRLTAIVQSGETSRWMVQAADRACPSRPVALLLRDGERILSRHVTRPLLSSSGPRDVPALEIDPPADVLCPGLFFELTGEPVTVPGTAGPDDGIVDVVVPVHGDFQATKACFDALLTRSPGTSMRVVAIDDASPDERISRLLDGLAAAGKLFLIRNPGNLGFVRSVNIGMARHPGRDVVLLNADTLVSDGWLARLRAAAHRETDTGTVTPWSNDATICSYPAANAPTALSCVDVDGLNRLAGLCLAGQVLDIPTAVGFCMYIRRDCLARVGWFDADAFGTGYGEENDFCLRAAAAGWRHRMALDLFVGHVGSASFTTAKQARIDAALAVLEQRYPGYQADIHAFIAADPLRAARRRLDMAQLEGQGPRRPTLIICAQLGGGTDRFIGQLLENRGSGGQDALILRPGQPETGHRTLRLEAPDAPHLTNLIYDAGTELDDLRADLRHLGVTEAELHHPAQLSGDLLSRLAGWFPYRAHIHDYGWICPRINLLDGNWNYCGEPETAQCETCVATHGDLLGIDRSVAAWRDLTRQILQDAQAVGCSSHDTANRMRRYVPAAHFQIAPAETALPVSPSPVLAIRQPGEALRIVVPGAIGPPKGYGLLLDCARDAVERDLPLLFLVLGYSMDDEALADTGRVFITGRYQETEVPALLAELRPHVALLPSVWPETWCYALSHVMAAGLPVAAFDMGAQAERLRLAGSGLLLTPGLSAKALNDALLAAFGPQ